MWGTITVSFCNLSHKMTIARLSVRRKTYQCAWRKLFVQDILMTDCLISGHVRWVGMINFGGRFKYAFRIIRVFENVAEERSLLKVMKNVRASAPEVTKIMKMSNGAPWKKNQRLFMKKCYFRFWCALSKSTSKISRTEDSFLSLMEDLDSCLDLLCMWLGEVQNRCSVW